MSFRDFCYANFGWFSRALKSLVLRLDKVIDAANMKIHPEVYLSVLGFIFLISYIPLILLLVIRFTAPHIYAFIPPLFLLLALNDKVLIIFAVIPLLIFLFGLAYPSLQARNRLWGLEMEIPYAGAYISVMASGGLSLPVALRRLRNVKDIFPKMAEEAGRIEAIRLAYGLDPISALERAISPATHKGLRDLFLGYASTLRTGGDILHFLNRKTELLFEERLGKVRAMGERLSALMEAYIILTVLGGIGLYALFVVSLSMRGMIGEVFSSNLFFLFSFVLIPIVSIFFIYLADTSQISYPASYKDRYIVFLLSFPPMLFLMLFMCFAFLFEMLSNRPFAKFFMNISSLLITKLGLPEGFEPSIGMGIALIAGTLPAAIYDYIKSIRDEGVLRGITMFLRDLVETRKSGLTPEKCIKSLANRDYGYFTKYVKLIARELSWGFPLRKIMSDVSKEMGNWLVKVNLFLLVDTIEVGGGTMESLDAMAKFSEMINMVESERRSLLKPLLIVPYIGAIVLVATNIMFLSFANNILGITGMSLGVIELYKLILPPAVLDSYFLGLVAGKISSGRVAAGFKHAVLLALISLLAIALVGKMGVPSFFGGGL